MRLLITGGAGLLGRRVAAMAADRNWQVAVLDRLPRDPRVASTHWFEGDVRDEAAVRRVYEAVQPTAVCHFAMQSREADSLHDPRRDADTNVMGSLNVLKASVDSGIDRLVLGSSSAIYGEVPSDSAEIARTPQPSTPHAAGLLAAEHYVQTFRDRHRLDASVLRFSSLYGCGMTDDSEAGEVPAYLARIQRRQPVIIAGRRMAGDDGRIRDYVHVDDAARAALAAAAGQIVEPTLNVGTGIGTSQRQLVRLLSRLLEVEAEVQQVRAAPTGAGRCVLNPARFTHYLGAPRALADGLSELVEAELEAAEMRQQVLIDFGLPTPANRRPLASPAAAVEPEAVLSDN